LQAKNMQGFRSVVYIVIAILNVAASIPLAKMWGGFGCALATGVSLTFGNIIIMNIYYHRRIGLNIPLFWSNIVRMTIPVLVALVCGYGLNYLISQDDWLTLACKIITYSIIYALIMWFLGLNIYEKTLFTSPVRRFFSKVAHSG
jgi:O-antigen/teichoic acid export membrane protein